MTRTVHTPLHQQEANWTKSQKELHKQRILDKMAKTKQIKNFQDRLLIKCKTWGGPCTNIEEMEKILSEKPDMQEVIIRTELSYYHQYHRSNIINHKDM